LNLATEVAGQRDMKAFRRILFFVLCLMIFGSLYWAVGFAHPISLHEKDSTLLLDSMPVCSLFAMLVWCVVFRKIEKKLAGFGSILAIILLWVLVIVPGS
jgi:hypothetical protein